MTDPIHWLTNWIDHNRYTVLGMGSLVCLALIATSCQATTRSPFDTAIDVTRVQLDADVTAYAAHVEAAYADLQRQDESIEKALQIMTGLAQQYGGPLVSPIFAALGIGGFAGGAGFIADNRRKNKVIKKSKAPGPVA